MSGPVMCSACVKGWHKACPGLRIIEARIVGPCECGCQQMTTMATPARAVPEEPPKLGKLERTAAVVGSVMAALVILAVVAFLVLLLVASVGDGPSCAGIDDLATSGRCGDP